MYLLTKCYKTTYDQVVNTALSGCVALVHVRLILVSIVSLPHCIYLLIMLHSIMHIGPIPVSLVAATWYIFTDQDIFTDQVA